LLIFGLLARMPHAGAALALTLHVVTTLGEGYAKAGLVGTASTLGQALGGPWRGLAVDRWGLRRALVPSVVVESLVWGSAPFLGFHGLLVASLVGGLLGLPTFTIVRQSLSVLVPPEHRRSAFAMDAMAVELTYLLGPSVVVLVATQVSTTVALLGVGSLMVVSGVALMIFNPPTRSDPTVAVHSADRRAFTVPATVDPVAEEPLGSRAGRRPRRREWFGPALVAVLCATAGTTFVLSGTDVGLVALLRERGQIPLLGLMFACWCGGSLLGALVYGALPRPVPPARLLLGLAVLTVPIGLASSPLALAALLVLAGGFCAPMITATTEAVSRLVPEESRGEAMGWHGSFLTVGVALGAPVSGAAMDRLGPWAGFTVVGVVGAVLAVAGLRTRRRPRVSWDLRVFGEGGRLPPHRTGPVYLSPGPAPGASGIAEASRKAS
jgi:MFS family permease